MKFVGTRGTNEKKTFSEVILDPAALNGGLYVPEEFVKIDLEEILNFDYITLTKYILKKFDVDIDEKTIELALERYKTFDTENVVEIAKVSNLNICELWHGPTRAFKDMALQPFGEILSQLAKQNNQDYLILAATSGDTGPATLKSFENKDRVKVVCLYPHKGTSEVQRLQMVTTTAKNEKVLGILGDFDDAQTALKNLLKDDDFRTILEEKDIKLSAANSVNFGRIIFQIVYHIYSYIHLVKNEDINLNDEIDIIVPSGNFGNALGGYYAKKMGLPIRKIVIASNKNNILYEFITYGKYDLRDKRLINTISPAMDILKSSNVERLLFDKFKEARTKELMESLEKNGYFQLNKEEIEAIQEEFLADFATDQECEEFINYYVKNYNYLMDPHTATAIKAYHNKKSELLDNVVVYSTAEWTKFAVSIYHALTKEDLNASLAALEDTTIADKDAIVYIQTHLNLRAPKSILELFEKDINEDIIEKEKIKNKIIEFISQ